ncbi:MAG: heavy metal translocating P-type ATPase [Syntrophorhabdaceae bacterium]|nr:heavy metal translocating P-type ATPase [Syntrophorhabdaceae bacterium]MDD4197122.1 heavy metal translocating P-type ATPase [Syntrophorhabdaceae bacterium]
MANKSPDAATETVVLHIEGMECGCEATLLDKKLRALAGVQDHEVNPVTHQLRVSFDPASATIQDVIRSVSETGMKASMQKTAKVRSAWWREKQQLALYGCGILAVAAFVLSKTGVASLIYNWVYVLSVLTGVYYPARKALIALVNLTPTIHLLMLIGSAGAMALGLWGESAVLIFVYSLGDVLESYAVDKARGALRSLTELMPREALVRTNTGGVVRPIDQVLVGDIVLVRPGERVPVDGQVIKGSSYVDQAAVTGEPIPVLRETGGEVFAGTINQNGSLEIKVQKAAADSMLSKIIYSVEEAQAKKGKLQRFSDAFGVYYTPAMFVLGVLVAIVPPLVMGAAWLPFIYRGLVVFVVSCSCGLALSVPVAIVAAMAKAAHKGTVFKGGAYLELVDRVKVIAFDKTGTLTIGRPEVTDVIPFGGASEQDVLDIAGAIESRSGHPLAAAIVRKARENGIFSTRAVDNFHENAGRGVTASVRGQSCIIGSPRCQEEQAVPLKEAEGEITRLENEGKTVVLLSTEGRLTGLIAIADTVRPGVENVLKRLNQSGVRTVMLTGDNERSAAAIAARIGIDEYDAGLLPIDKVEIVRRLKEKHGMVAMVGDGINDAPAMAVADVGIAMGAAGTDIAIEAGDVVLMSDDLDKLAFVRELSNRAVKTIRQNIVVSLVNVAFMVVMALMGYLGLVTGLLLNEASALFVIINALRLLKWRDSKLPSRIEGNIASGTLDERRLATASPFPLAQAGCCCGEAEAPPAFSTTETTNSACCSGASSPVNSSFPTFPVAEVQGSCCSPPTGSMMSDERTDGAISKDGMKSATFRIDGMSCSCEGLMVEKRVKSLKSVANFSFNPITNQMKLTYDPSSLTISEIETAVKKAGAKAVLQTLR